MIRENSIENAQVSLEKLKIPGFFTSKNSDSKSLLKNSPSSRVHYSLSSNSSAAKLRNITPNSLFGLDQTIIRSKSPESALKPSTKLSIVQFLKANDKSAITRSQGRLELIGTSAISVTKAKPKKNYELIQLPPMHKNNFLLKTIEKQNKHIKTPKNNLTPVKFPRSTSQTTIAKRSKSTYKPMEFRNDKKLTQICVKIPKIEEQSISLSGWDNESPSIS